MPGNQQCPPHFHQLLSAWLDATWEVRGQAQGSTVAQPATQVATLEADCLGDQGPARRAWRCHGALSLSRRAASARAPRGGSLGGSLGGARTLRRPRAHPDRQGCPVPSLGSPRECVTEAERAISLRKYHWTSAHTCTRAYAHVPSTCVCANMQHIHTYMRTRACSDVHARTHARMRTHGTHSAHQLGPPPQKKKPVHVSDYNCISESIRVAFPQTRDALRGKHT